ncbi:hypothetical protein [Salinactinospora qingdaonensis]|uniref:Uncharacterized protein n=1 Tax=Salinactinospora qingdaonensis TaxID=702744 RepID=A0ABP7FFE9_9ACTN
MDILGFARTPSVFSPQRLRSQWYRHSKRAGWTPADDWWTPAVDDVCEAVVHGADLESPCTRFGHARARMGTTVGAALEDFAALCDVLGWASCPVRPVKAIAEGWAEAICRLDDCRDPLTGLATPGYLRLRLEEIYAAAAEPPERTHRLLIVALDGVADPWRRTARLIVLGHELRRFFIHGETLALLNRHRIAALVPLAADLAERIKQLQTRLSGQPAAHVWSVAPPPSHREALHLLTDVGRVPMGP